MANVYRVKTGDGNRKIPEFFRGLASFIGKDGLILLNANRSFVAEVKFRHFQQVPRFAILMAGF
jgi:hypothetical protein